MPVPVAEAWTTPTPALPSERATGSVGEAVMVVIIDAKGHGKGGSRVTA